MQNISENPGYTILIEKNKPGMVSYVDNDGHAHEEFDVSVLLDEALIIKLNAVTHMLHESNEYTSFGFLDGVANEDTKLIAQKIILLLLQEGKIERARTFYERELFEKELFATLTDVFPQLISRSVVDNTEFWQLATKDKALLDSQS